MGWSDKQDKNCLYSMEREKIRITRKIIVVNNLMLSVCAYVMSVIEMPEWVMNELNKIVGETLVGNGWKGGFNLI